jgi:hypothetical protein
MSLTTEFPSLWAEINPRLGELAVEAKELRESPGVSDVSEDVADLHDRLVSARQAQDRLEAILSEVGRLRSRARIAVSERQDEYDDQWRTVMEKTRIGEYDSAKEKNARYDAGSIQQLVNLRRAKRAAADVDEVYEYINLKYRGLDAARREIDSRVRMLTVANQLER